MTAIRILLLLFMSFWILLMAGCPGLHDSKRMAVAAHHHHEADTEGTRYELAEAHRLDRRNILIYESIMAAVLGVAIFGFIRAGRR